jgi:hypothetical protein
MARCPDCNKFVSYEEQEPEVTIEVDGGAITGTARIVNACQDCGTELTEFTFEVSQEIEDADAHEGDSHEMSVETSLEERTTRTEGRGRKPRTFYGFSCHYTVACSCTPGKEVESGEITDDCQASEMESLV